MNYSIIIPYQHSEERLPLLHACLSNLVHLSNNLFEICIHEVGPEKSLNLPNKYKYHYTEFKGVFHRAWAINRGVRKLATSNILVLMDGDLIVTSEWVEAIKSCSNLSVGWGKLHLLNESGTHQYLRTKYIDNELVYKKKSPSMGSAAGAVTVIPKDLFFQVKGIPEDFAGSWGGEDNAFWSKMIRLGHKLGRLKGSIYHLHHSPSTPRVRAIQSKIFPMIHWTETQWKEHIKVTGDNWGRSNYNLHQEPTIPYISSINSPKLTFAMLSWLRYDKLVATLKSLKETLTIPVNMVIMVQGTENLEQKQRRNIRELAYKFKSNDVFFTKGNIGTGPARRVLLARALRRFYSPYINLADDDTDYTPGSVEAALDLLDSDYSIGIVGIRYKTNIYRLNSQIHPTALLPEKATQNLEYVDCTGSASAFIRREVFNQCKIDPVYKIGQWDLDLFLQARATGWKIVNYQAFKEMRANNNFGGCPEYRRARMNRKGIRNSVARFKQKWGLSRLS